MSPIQEETGPDNLEEEGVPEDQTNSYAESPPDVKKRAKRFKKIKSEHVSAGKSNVLAHNFLFCLKLGLNRTSLLLRVFCLSQVFWTSMNVMQ